MLRDINFDWLSAWKVGEESALEVKKNLFVLDPVAQVLHALVLNFNFQISLSK